ncbi:hypothetical protein RvY_16574-2 [Ramazzottius varieornatus]|uniref:Uncharacterized protein n=1 Tax=Ramazzottius varieornatus TaxID=947166 RepID=A0A1D1VYY9_RAMVA|nr:hypothetical protein RvY_16574-2 [Ramazzottius varieornatus]
MFSPPFSWHVLSYLLLIPDPSSNLEHTRRHLSFYPHFLARKILILSTTLLLWVFLFLAILNVFNNQSAWRDYTTSPNKIISLLIILRPVVVNWKSSTAILQFALNSRHLTRFLVALKRFEVHVTVSHRQTIKHRRLFYAIVAFPVSLYILRYVLFGRMMHHLKQKASLGSINPNNQTSISAVQIFEETTYVIISGVGAFLALCINVQMAFYASVLKEYCTCLNKRLADLRDRLMKQDLCFKYKPFQTELQDLRGIFEDLINLHSHFESIFGLQILAGIINHLLVTFSSIAAFFQYNNQPVEWFIFHGSSCVSFVYTLLLLSIFPIRLHDQSIQTAETVQSLMYHYQLINSRNYYDIQGFPKDRSLSHRLRAVSSGAV